MLHSIANEGQPTPVERARSRNLDKAWTGLNLPDLVYPDVAREAPCPCEEVRLFTGEKPDLARDPVDLVPSGSAPTPTLVQTGWAG